MALKYSFKNSSKSNSNHGSGTMTSAPATQKISQKTAPANSTPQAEGVDILDFFYNNIDKMTLGKVSVDEAETIIITRKDTDRATIVTSESTTFNKLKKSIAGDPDHKEWEVEGLSKGYGNDDPYRLVELMVSCPKKLISIRSKSAPKREMTDEERQALRERMKKALEARQK